jgi:hypothetical protein
VWDRRVWRGRPRPPTLVVPGRFWLAYIEFESRQTPAANTSRGAAAYLSPGRKPWVGEQRIGVPFRDDTKFF